MLAAQLLQNPEDSRGFGPMSVVGVHLGVSDRTILRDDITGGHRQSPSVLPIELRQVRTKRFLDLAQIVGQSPAHAELSGNFATVIAQDRELEPILPLRFAEAPSVPRSNWRRPQVGLYESVHLETILRSS